MPYLGALSHLDWLASLSIPEGLKAKDFLVQTGAVQSLARLIHRCRYRWPSQYVESYIFDTQHIDMGPEWSGIFSSTVSLAQELPKSANGDVPSHQALSLYGRPNPGDRYGFDYEYTAVIPVKGSTYIYDPSRPIKASITRGNGGGINNFEAQEYNEVASDPSRRIPGVLFFTIQHAATDIKRVIDHVNGFDGPQPKLEPAPAELARWHPDYLTDDPNEFLKVS